MEETDFAYALRKLKNGLRVQRAGWNGKGMWLELQEPDEDSKMQKPYIFIKTAEDKKVPWCASHGDLLGTDWRVV